MTTTPTIPGNYYQKVVAILQDTYGNDIFPDSSYTQAIENNSMGQAIYVGESAPGTLQTTAEWRIKKLTYDSNNFITNVEWADGTSDFTKRWDQRATYVYS